MNRWTLTNTDTGEVLNMPYDPKGWDEITLTHERDEKWHGVFYGFSQEVGFFCKGGGKEFVDAAYDSKGQEARVKCKLETQCNGLWTIVINGKVNFSSYRQEYVSNVLYTFLNIENDDITTLIKNREDTDVDLLSGTSLNGTALNYYNFLNYDLNLHSKLIKATTRYDQSGTTTSVCRAFDTSINNLHIAEWTKEVGEINQSQDIGESFESASVSTTSFKPAIEFGEGYEYPFNTVVSWNMEGIFQGDLRDVEPDCGTGTLNAASFTVGGNQIIPNGPNGTKVFLLLKVGQNFNDAIGWGLVEINGTGSVIADVFSGTFNNTGSVTIPINQNDKVWLMWIFAFSINTSGGTRDVKFEIIYTSGEITFTADTLTPATTGKAIAIHEAWSRLCEIITDQPLAFKSEYFGRTNSQGISYGANGFGSFTSIITGLAIRGIDARFETNLNDMFESCYAQWGIGLGVEGSLVRVEDMRYFYNNTVVLTLDNVPRIQMSHVDSIVYNEIELGFEEWETEALNGLDEPNTHISWSSQFIKSNKNKFTAVSSYVGGMYAIELTRRVRISSEDTRYDEEIFFIALNTTTNGTQAWDGVPTSLNIAEKAENFPGTIGITGPDTAYNLRLMPNLSYHRLSGQFTSGWVKLSPDNVKLSSTEGNIGVTYQYAPAIPETVVYPGGYNGTVQTNVSDKVYIDNKMGSLGLPIWEPEQYQFEYPLPLNDYLTFLNNPYGLIRFSDTDNNYIEGWVKMLEYNLKVKSANFTIIRKYVS